MNFSNYDDNDELHSFEKTFVPLMAELELKKKLHNLHVLVPNTCKLCVISNKFNFTAESNNNKMSKFSYFTSPSAILW